MREVALPGTFSIFGAPSRTYEILFIEGKTRFSWKRSVSVKNEMDFHFVSVKFVCIRGTSMGKNVRVQFALCLTVLTLSLARTVAASPTPIDKMTLDPKASWAETKAYYLAKILDDSGWQKRWWLEKAVRLARGGRGWEANENPNDWINLSQNDIVNKLLNDPRFGDMALDFNMYFTGNRIDQVTVNGDYSPMIFEYFLPPWPARARSSPTVTILNLWI